MTEAELADPPKLSSMLSPGDVFVVCVIPAGTQNLNILTDGSRKEHEYAAMLIAALNVLVAKLGESAGEPSRIVQPFPSIRNRG
jgi:hypothetical protein